MEIHKLEPNVIAKIRSSATINSVTNCITELVLNSLDAKSTAIAVRTNFVTFRIQVVDNGDGIIKDQLESSCAYYGFRGEALASIVTISKIVEITSRPKNSSKTWSRSLTRTTTNAICGKDRPSCGTTVTVEGFLYNLPLRKKRVIPEVELTYIKRNIECLIIMHPNVSFSLRNDVTGDLILNSRKCEDIISSFKSLHPELTNEYSLMKVSKSNVTIKGLFFKELRENNSMQYIYVNKRPVKCSKIQTFISNLFQKNKKIVNEVFRLNSVPLNDKSRHHVYVINVKCPYSFVDILLSSTKTIVEFKNWDIVFSCIEKLVLSFLGCNGKSAKANYVMPRKAIKTDCGISQIHGVFKSYGVKRTIAYENTNSPPKKVQKPISTQNDTMDRVPQLSINNMSSNNVFSRKQIKNSKLTETKQPQTQLINKENIYSLKNTNNISEFSYKYSREKDGTNTNKIENVPNYQISTNNKNFDKKIRPLPVEVFNKYAYLKKNASRRIESKPYKIKGNNCDSHIPLPPNETSSLTKFTNDENKGKNLIMDMFLKSTQVFNSDDEYQDDKSRDTVLEMESNYFLENNITTNINGKSKTMSVSINITRKIKKKCNASKRHRTTSKSVQTSLKQKKMIAKCVQTSTYQTLDNVSSGLNNCSKLADYTIILSRTRAPKFKFIHQDPLNLSYIGPKMSVKQSDCNCKCHHTHIEKIFDFGNSKYNNKSNHIANGLSNCNFYGDTLSAVEALRDRYTKQNDLEFMKSVTNHERNYHRESNLEDYRSRVDIISINKRPGNGNEIYQKSKEANFFGHESPYFLTAYRTGHTKNCLNFGNKSPNIGKGYELFNPQYKSTQLSHLFNKNPIKKTNNIEHTKVRKYFEKCNASYSVFSKINGQRNEFVPLNTFVSENINNYNINDTDMRSLLAPSRNFQCFNLSLENEVADMPHFEMEKYESKEKSNTIFHYNPTQTSAYKTKTTPYPRKIIDHCNQFTFSNIIGSKSVESIYKTDKHAVPNVVEDPYKNLASTPKNKCSNEREGNSIFHYNAAGSHDDVASAHITKTAQDLEDKLFITLSNRQKQEILENELNAEKLFFNKINFEWESQMALSKEKEVAIQNKSEDFGQEWIKKQNDFGSNFYINKRTGYTTFYTPKPTSNDFKMCKRFEFMPKGLSPILKETEAVNESLSQNKKVKLETYILESHQDELLMIKWQKYIKNSDTKTFFDEMYKDKLHSFENCIPSALHSNKHFSELNSVAFDKTLFNNITVIGQVDKKFIAVLEETKRLVILFDQHAVHERIRLENLLQGYSNAKVPSRREEFAVFLSHNDLSLLKKHEKYLIFLGLRVEFFEDGLNVVDIPSCLHNKFKNTEGLNSLNAVVQLLIKEIIELIKETRGVTFKNFPKIIQNILNLEACRGAIKFGDKLSNSRCEQLLKELSICNLPFQCAHGRPTLVPLLTLNLANLTVSKAPNFTNIYSIKDNSNVLPFA